MTQGIPPAPPLPHAVSAPQLHAGADEADEDEREPHVLLARYRKARRVAKVLIQHGATAESALELGKTELGRTMAAQVAGTRVPSKVTWPLVVELVSEVRP